MTYTSTSTSTSTSTNECENCETLEDNTPKFSLGCCIKLDDATKADLLTLCDQVDISWNSTCNGRTTVCTDGIQALKDLLQNYDLKNCFNIV